MVFNVGMHPDSTLIDGLGGPAAVAKLLGYDKVSGGTQRVHNWRTRGIPAKVKVERPDLFLAAEVLRSRSTPTSQQAEAAKA